MWNNILAISHQKIDEDHVNIDLMLHLFATGRAPKLILEKIAPTGITHMNHEEKIIQQRGHTFPAAHHKEHQRLAILPKLFKKDWQQKTINCQQFGRKIQNILKLHILDFDLKLSELMKQPSENDAISRRRGKLDV